MKNLPKLLITAVALAIRKASEALKAKGGDERIAIWSITSVQAKIFFPMVISMWVVALAYITYDGVIQAKTLTPEDIKTATINFGQTVLAIVAIAMILSALITTAWRQAYSIRRIFAMRVLDKLYDLLVRPIETDAEAKGQAKGRAEGRTEGRAEGIDETMNWMNRKAEAETKGLPFDEPPPQPTPEKPPKQ